MRKKIVALLGISLLVGQVLATTASARGGSSCPVYYGCPAPVPPVGGGGHGGGGNDNVPPHA